MPRPYSDKFMLMLMDENREDTLGTSLAKICIKASLPANYVSSALGVSKLTIHNWFRGSNIRKKYVEVINAFISLIDKDMEAGILPAKSTAAAKTYIETMIGREI